MTLLSQIRALPERQPGPHNKCTLAGKTHVRQVSRQRAWIPQRMGMCPYIQG